MRVEIEYCRPCNYKPRASSLAAKILAAFPSADVELVPGTRGVFNVKADGRELWNKNDRGTFPDEQALVAQLLAAP